MIGGDDFFWKEVMREGRKERREKPGPDRQKLWVEGIGSDSEVID